MFEDAFSNRARIPSACLATRSADSAERGTDELVLTRGSASLPGWYRTRSRKREERVHRVIDEQGQSSVALLKRATETELEGW